MSSLSRLNRDKPVKAKGFVHELVAETAKGCAREVYQECARNNDFYKLWPSEDEFVHRRWHSFIQDARQALTAMLQPHMMTSEEDKATIYEALKLNAAAMPAKSPHSIH